jgi:hypothetical protein
VLEGRLEGDRAAAAAAGWGADRLIQFDHRDHDTAYAWVLRWDDPDEADEFAAAMTDYLDARGDRTAGHWTDGDATFALHRVDDETVVVLAGPEPFVDNATATGSNADVTVTVGADDG